MPTEPRVPDANPDIGAVSTAKGPFVVDWDRARRDAQKVLNSLDFSKRDLVIWAAGTGSSRLYTPLADAVQRTWNTGNVSVTTLAYEASWKLRSSLPTGLATMKLVLAGIAAHGGDHRVLLTGVSQGAWIIGEAMADPMLRRVVDRAVLLGHPMLAAHQYLDGHDSKVRVINHSSDPIAQPVTGDPTIALDAMIAVNQLDVSKIGTVLTAAWQNPALVARLAATIVHITPILKHLIRNPHDYGDEMTFVADYLRFGPVPGSS